MKPPIRNPIGAALLALLVSLFALSLRGQMQTAPLTPLVASDFDDLLTAADGWKGTNNANGTATLTWQSTNGNPLGYVSISESAGDSATMYFVAPAKFLGDQRAAYNGVLAFDLRQSAQTQLYWASDVVLGSSNLMLTFRFATIPPANAWKRFEVPLNHISGWVNRQTGELATREDLLAVLAMVDRLWIRAEFSTHNSDRADLDNVMLLAQPSGPTRPRLTASTVVGITIEGQAGRTYRVEWRSALGDTNTWQKLVDVILPTSPYFFVDQSSAAVSARFYQVVLEEE